MFEHHIQLFSSLVSKKYPLPPANVGFPIPQTMNFEMVQHSIGRGGLAFLNSGEVVVRK